VHNLKKGVILEKILDTGNFLGSKGGNIDFGLFWNVSSKRDFAFNI